ncbi:MAG: hypothetical protein NTZ69_08170 [Bacteroidia bacterium]|nr:hypothetical protein [Bacteroidia bacterium]
MNLRKASPLLFSAIGLWALTACGNSNAVNKQANSSAEITQSSQPGQPIALPHSDSKIQAELDKAKKEGKAVFVVITGTGVTETDKATTIAKGANAIYKNATVVQMDRDDASNSQLVAEWRLAGAPLPLVLVVSPKGQLSGGMILAQATSENIAALVPSPKLEEVQEVISNKRPVFVVFTKKTYSDRTEVLQACKEAVTILKNNAAIVEVDLDDIKEVNLIDRLEVDKSSKETTTQVVNVQGQIAGTSSGLPDAAKLAAAAIAPPKSGCCPGGAGSPGCAK